jgi:hypothetical protein
LQKKGDRGFDYVCAHVDGDRGHCVKWYCVGLA